MKITTRIGPDSCEIIPEGDIDAKTAHLFEDSLRRAVQIAGCSLIVNCEHVGYISSAGLGVVVSLLKDIQASGGKLVFTNVPDDVLWVLEMVALTDYVDIENNREVNSLNHARLTVPGKAEHLKNIKEFTRDFLKKTSIVGADEFKILLAIEEICTNLVRHSFSPNTTQCIMVDIEREEKQVIIQVRDQGVLFDPSTYKWQNIDELMQARRKGGLGLQIINKIMFEVKYTTDGDWNVTTMTHHLN